MKKPRIIIADRDQAYAMPLLHKFIKEFYRRAEFELISDSTYFEKLFIQQQMAEVLIISEELYENVLQRHDIRHIFILTNEKDNRYSEYASVNVIYKYSNIQDIFNEISGKCAEAFDAVTDNNEETRLVLFLSASGGIDKTTAAFNIALSLVRQSKRVLYINSSRLQSFGYLFDNCKQISDKELYSYMADTDEDIYQKIKNEIKNREFDYLPPFKAALITLGLPEDIFLRIAAGARVSKDYDYILMDTDSIFDEAGVGKLNAADKAVIITADDQRAVFETNRLAENINGINSDKYLFICFRHKNERKNDLTSHIKAKYEIDEYIDYQNETYMNVYIDLSMDNGIKKIAYLLGE